MPQAERVTTRNAPRVYGERTGRSAEADAAWGTICGALVEVKKRILRGVLNVRRERQGSRLLEEPLHLPGWAARAMASLPSMLPDLVDVDARFATAASAEFLEATRRLAAGCSCAEAASVLGNERAFEGWFGRAADHELTQLRIGRARNDTVRAFFDGTRVWLGRVPRPYEMMLLAATAELEAIEPGATVVRKLWEKRIQRWKNEPPRGPFGDDAGRALPRPILLSRP